MTLIRTKYSDNDDDDDDDTLHKEYDDDDNNNNNNNNGHCAHTSESANVKVHYRVNTRTSDMGTINSSDRIAATLYSLGTLFVCINTLHKGDSGDNNNNNINSR
jgi:hypothetical protein